MVAAELERSASRAQARGGIAAAAAFLAAAEQASEHPQELWSTFILPELIEAAVRTGRTARAAEGP
jgi:hypothetical protein